MSQLPGLFFTLTERYLLERDEALMERVLRRTGQDRTDPWVDAQEYPAEDLEALLQAAGEELGLDRQRLLFEMAEWSAPVLMRRFSSLVAGLSTPLEFLEVLGTAVYPQLCRMLGCDVRSQLEYSRTGAQSCSMVYRSPRSLCVAVEGALQGVCRHFGVPMHGDHVRCQLRGDDCCEIRLDFESGA